MKNRIGNIAIIAIMSLVGIVAAQENNTATEEDVLLFLAAQNQQENTTADSTEAEAEASVVPTAVELAKLPVQGLIKTYYVGALYSYAADVKAFEKPEESATIRGGVIAEIPTMKEQIIYTRPVLDLDEKGNGNFFADVRLIQRVGSELSFSAGYLPTATRMIQVFGAVCSDGHFLPPSKGVISPGYRMGGTARWGNENQAVLLGRYANRDGSVEHHLGVQWFNFGPFTEITGSVFAANRETITGKRVSGAALALSTKYANVQAYKEVQGDGTIIRSYFLGYNLPKGWSGYVTAVSTKAYRQNQVWNNVEAGFTRDIDDPRWFHLHYRYGAAFSFHPERTFNLYLQLWLQ